MRSERRRQVTRIVALLLLASMVLPFLATQLASPAEAVAVWHAYPEGTVQADTIQAYVEALASSRPRVKVQVRALGDQFGGALVQGVGSGTFPDIILAPAEWVPLLDDIGLLAAVPADDLDQYLPGVAAAVSSEGRVRALPAFTAVLALGRRPATGGDDPVPWPDTLAAMIADAGEAAGAGLGGLYWPVDDLYYTVPWLLGAGGYLEPPPDPSPGSPAGGAAPPVADDAVRAWLRAVERARAAAIPGSGDVDLVSAWLAGEIAFAAVTPGEVTVLRSSGAAIDVGPIPEARGYLSTWAWMLSAYAGEPRSDAIRLLARIQAADGGEGPSLALSVRQLPAMVWHFDEPASAERGIDGFLSSAQSGIPMPAGPLARELWTIYEMALQEFLAGAKAETVLASLKNRTGELYAPDQEP
ncbi:MAG: hypothetical protein Q8P31_07180 [Bacillota bacterium]|nr:hypothetical protein [Bacillota bacterium]